MKKILRTLPFALVLPGMVLAQSADLGYFTDLIDDIANLLGTLIPVVIGIGLLFFIWGLVQYISASGDEAAKDEGKRKMIWGVVTLFVIVAVWGLVEILANLVGVNTGTAAPDAPTIPS